MEDMHMFRWDGAISCSCSAPLYLSLRVNAPPPPARSPEAPTHPNSLDLNRGGGRSEREGGRGRLKQPSLSGIETVRVQNSAHAKISQAMSLPKLHLLFRKDVRNRVFDVTKTCRII